MLTSIGGSNLYKAQGEMVLISIVGGGGSNPYRAQGRSAANLNRVWGRYESVLPSQKPRPVMNRKRKIILLFHLLKICFF